MSQHKGSRREVNPRDEASARYLEGHAASVIRKLNDEDGPLIARHIQVLADGLREGLHIADDAAGGDTNGQDEAIN